MQIDVPANARLTDRYSEHGWVCLRGFRAKDNSCEPVSVPENAYLAEEIFSIGWKCERGFRALSGACEAIDLPEHAHLNRVGDGWDCNRPYTRVQDLCIIDWVETN